MPAYKTTTGCEYIVDDAVDTLKNLEEEAAAIFLDDAWARPQRRNQFGVTYDTHPFSKDTVPSDEGVDTSVTTIEILDACFNALKPGGWLIADTDDWLLPRLVNYLQKEWGDVAQSYKGGGYRKVGGVTYLSGDGEPDQSTAGMYLSTGGYPVVFAHKGETDRRSSVSARQIADRQREQYDWGSVKPLAPYVEWVEALVEPSELIIVPCAGTAPAALAAEKLFEEESNYICIDNKKEAYDAFMQRYEKEVTKTTQKTL